MMTKRRVGRRWLCWMVMSAWATAVVAAFSISISIGKGEWQRLHQKTCSNDSSLPPRSLPSSVSVQPTSSIIRSIVSSGKPAWCRSSSTMALCASSTDASTSNDPVWTASHYGRRQRAPRQQRDVVIIGGGLAGLSTALFLSQMDPNRHITIYDSDPAIFQQQSTATARIPVASTAAAGMLAPHSERLPAGPLLDLCLQSRAMYADFCDLVESLAQVAGPEGEKFLMTSQQQPTSNNPLAPWEVGYVASGGFLAPAFAGDSVATWAPPCTSGYAERSDSAAAAVPAAAAGETLIRQSASAQWLDANQIREMEPYLNPNVIGGWWFPEDANVDAVRLTCSLRAACVAAGVQILYGHVTSLDLQQGECRGIWIRQGQESHIGGNTHSRSGSDNKSMYVTGKTFVVANGAWMRQLLPVPMEPHKGQSLSLRMPADRPPILRRVLFAQDSYIVPKADGRIVIGATVEAGSFNPYVTPTGLMHILEYALELVPALKDLPIEDTWVGLRPTTPDKGPILGSTPWNNMFLAGGYWRNGVLLAPKTGELLATLISRPDQLTESDQAILKAFAWNRFTDATKSTKVVAESRYAASMHPVHTRTSGSGVSVAVGTELGSYSTAWSAKQERAKDRRGFLRLDKDNNEDDDDDETDVDDENALERAAALGIRDAAAFHWFDSKASSTPLLSSSSPSLSSAGDRAFTDGAAQAKTSIGTKSEQQDGLPQEGDEPQHTTAESTSLDIPSDLSLIYRQIADNKAKVKFEMEQFDSAKAAEARPDPGFRIYHVDAVTREQREVPPYTKPEDFRAQLEQEQMHKNNIQSGATTSNGTAVTNTGPVVKDDVTVASEVTFIDPPKTNGIVDTDATEPEYSEDTFDGYQTILSTYEGVTREEELEAMKEVRRKNRMETPSNYLAKLDQATAAIGQSRGLNGAHEDVEDDGV